MNETKKSETRGPGRKKNQDSDKFEETFKPQKSTINFGAVKNEKAKKAKKGRSKKALIILGVILLLLAGSVFALYKSGIMDPALRKAGILKVTPVAVASPKASPTASTDAAPSPSTDATPSPSADTESSPSTEPSPSGENVSGIKPEEPSPGGGKTSTVSPSPQTFEDLVSGLSDEKLTEDKHVGAIYSKMDAASAASIMTSIYEPDEIAVIVYYMEPASSALVLSKMDPALAAAVTRIMMS